MGKFSTNHATTAIVVRQETHSPQWSIGATENEFNKINFNKLIKKLLKEHFNQKLL